jgi:flagellin
MTSNSEGIRRNLFQATNDFKKSSEALSSGKRNPRENPAAAAVAQILEADAAQIKVSSRNVADGASLINTFESTVDQVGNVLGRLSELATQSANGTLSDDQRASLNAEFTQLKEEISRQTASTEFNGVKLGDSVSLQVGANSDQLPVSTGDPAALNASLESVDISTQAGAQEALNLVSQASESVNALKSTFGATESRLDSIGSSLQGQEVALREAASRIQDIDVAQEVANRTAASIKQSIAATALNSFKNINAQVVSRLLQ